MGDICLCCFRQNCSYDNNWFHFVCNLKIDYSFSFAFRSVLRFFIESVIWIWVVYIYTSHIFGAKVLLIFIFDVVKKCWGMDFIFPSNSDAIRDRWILFYLSYLGFRSILWLCKFRHFLWIVFYQEFCNVVAINEVIL